MKKTFFLILLPLAFLTGCSKESGDTLERIKSKGEIVIAMEGAWAPWTYHDQENNLTGYDVAVGKKIAEKLGVKATFVEVDWDGIFAGLDSKRYDLACNGVEATKERSYKYDFSIPYAYTQAALIVRKDNDYILSLEDLNGKTTTNSIGSTYENLAVTYGAKVITIDSFDQTLELVEQGRADATFNDTATFSYYQKVQPENNFKIAAYAPKKSKVAIPMRKGKEDESLRQAVNSALEDLISSGELATLSVEFFGRDLTKEHL